jgi:hypothetical protein
MKEEFKKTVKEIEKLLVEDAKNSTRKQSIKKKNNRN